MNETNDIDLQAQVVSNGLTRLHDLLDKPVAREALDLTKNATTANQYDILRRLRQSLRQYLGRDGDLFYVGLLGHFSAGKSSTINSLLEAWNSTYERNTGLNPTDTTVTLITRAKNSGSLFGVIREGHVTIRHEAVESPMLENMVLADTPGTGDPQFMQEIARDFLPICDVILFLLSAASPLDKSDLPLLSELHRRLQFIPVFFVVTRADELRIEFSKPISEQNLDQKKKAQFLGEVASRVNVLLKPQVYAAEQFILIDNKSGFNVDELRHFLAGRCNSSSPQARVTMHANKMQYYLSGAKELRDFFADFLDTKLTELNKIVGAAERNIQKYQQIVQISNSNLTKAWLDYSIAINQARSRPVEQLKQLSELPDSYAHFASVAKKRAEISGELTRDASFVAASACAVLRNEVVSNLRDHLYKTQKAVAETEFSDSSAKNYQIRSPRIEHKFGSSESASPATLSRKYNDLRDSQADALLDTAGDLRRAGRDVDELLQQQAPFADSQTVVQTARESLAKDLSQFFQNVELYRNGVFSHTTKESISTLGIGRDLDELESEFNDDDKASYTATAVSELFPGFNDLAIKATNSIATLSERLRTFLESARSVRIDRPTDSYQAIESAAAAAESPIQADVIRQLQSDVDRLCGRVGAAVASLLVNTKSDYDAAMRVLKAARRRRYFLIATVTALLLIASDLGYYHYNTPAPESTLGTIALHVIAGLIVEVLVVLIARWREKVPKLTERTRERFQVALSDNVRKAIESELKVPQLDALNELIIANRLHQAYERIFSSTTDAWHTTAAATLRTLRKLRSDYESIRGEYLALIDEIHGHCAAYFTDASKNLEILNAVANKIKEQAIEPSFGLLDRTRKELEYVKTEIKTVDFT
jgi:predicted GTPase